MSTNSNHCDTDSWERDWVTRVVAATAKVEGDPAMTNFIDSNTEVQFGNNPIVKGLEGAMPIIGNVYKHAAKLWKNVTRIHIDTANITIYVNYTVHVIAKGDPEAKELVVPTCMILVKPLGKQQENIQRMEVYNDFGSLFKRVEEIESS